MSPWSLSEAERLGFAYSLHNTKTLGILFLTIVLWFRLCPHHHSQVGHFAAAQDLRQLQHWLFVELRYWCFWLPSFVSSYSVMYFKISNAQDETKRQLHHMMFDYCRSGSDRSRRTCGTMTAIISQMNQFWLDIVQPIFDCLKHAWLSGREVIQSWIIAAFVLRSRETSCIVISLGSKVNIQQSHSLGVLCFAHRTKHCDYQFTKLNQEIQVHRKHWDGYRRGRISHELIGVPI